MKGQPKTFAPSQFVYDSFFMRSGRAAIANVNLVSQPEDGAFLVWVKVKGEDDPIYLSTRRNPDEPRRFYKVYAAINAAHKAFGVTEFKVAVNKDFMPLTIGANKPE